MVMVSKQTYTFNRSDSSVPIIITLIAMEEGSVQLLMEVEDEFGNLILDLDEVERTEAVNRFG